MIPYAIPTDRRVGMQVFTVPDNAGSISSNRGWLAWDKPKGASWLYILNQNPGGGGGGGRTGAAGSARGGGGGGASGSKQCLLVPACLIPDTLWLRVNRGAPGGAANTNGTAATTNGIAVAPDGATIFGFASGGGGGGGSAGTASAGGTGGTAGAVGGLSVYSSGALFYTIAGQAGTAGGAHTGAAGGALSLPTTIGTSGGTGGGGTPTGNTNFAGGAIPAGGPFPAIAGGTAAGGVGQPGFNRGLRLDSLDNRLSAFFTSGGTGGGSNGAAGVGGVGGEGGWGSGGGGGGAGVTGGAGGKGGDGFVIIMWW